MNTFWLKIAAVVVLIVVVIVVIGVFTGERQPKQPQKTVYDQWEQDQKRLNAEPQYKQPPPQGQPTRPVQPPRPAFKELSPEEEFEAEKLWEMVMTERKMGRLPGMTYKRMVDYCRQIIQKWPHSEYTFKAKRALADLPEQYRKMYNITDEEINLGNYK